MHTYLELVNTKINYDPVDNFLAVAASNFTVFLQLTKQVSIENYLVKVDWYQTQQITFDRAIISKYFNLILTQIITHQMTDVAFLAKYPQSFIGSLR